MSAELVASASCWYIIRWCIAIAYRRPREGGHWRLSIRRARCCVLQLIFKTTEPRVDDDVKTPLWHDSTENLVITTSFYAQLKYRKTQFFQVNFMKRNVQFVYNLIEAQLSINL
jgi:hypothetical protein